MLQSAVNRSSATTGKIRQVTEELKRILKNQAYGDLGGGYSGTGSRNRVMYKLALVSLKQYPFFLTQLSTFGYLPFDLNHVGGILNSKTLCIKTFKKKHPKNKFVAAVGIVAGDKRKSMSICVLDNNEGIILNISYMARLCDTKGAPSIDSLLDSLLSRGRLTTLQ
ncbi:hypothetical protein DY000_02040142 [Brassica cretica]|uniref:Uncharacterized protein n=1 Tax=Brassica cretica TaxID=69181 RepID=A0ABQ7B8F2_BRACR|nr:hypothetical protein DY000_02040142 [Brassica cretica]